MTYMVWLLLAVSHAGVFSNFCARYIVADSFEGDPDQQLEREADLLGIKAKWGTLDEAGWRRLRAIENELASRRRIEAFLKQTQ